MNPDAPTPRLDRLLGRLVLLAGDVRDLLSTGNVDAAVPVQEEFDEAFAQLQRLVETGHAFDRRHEAVLSQLRDVHRENERLTRALRDAAGEQLGTVTRVKRVSSAYAPLGSNHLPSPRFIDGAA